jgi:proteasome activator subunit 4
MVWTIYAYFQYRNPSRYLYACRSILLGLPTFIKENAKNVVNPCINEEHEVSSLVVSHLDVAAGFALTDPKDPRYQKTIAWRETLGSVLLAASASLRHLTGGEDHTDAVISVTRAIDTYLLSYAVNRAEFDSMQKNYVQARE